MTDAMLHGRLRTAALLTMLGLMVELVSLTWHHPTAFLVFVLIGGTLMAGGMCLYLYSIVSRGG